MLWKNISILLVISFSRKQKCQQLLLTTSEYIDEIIFVSKHIAYIDKI